MKAALALIAIYVATFIVATQGSSQNPVQASAPDNSTSVSSKSIDPAKQEDLRSLVQLTGARDQVQDAASTYVVQYREKLLASAPDKSNRDIVDRDFTETYRTKFDEQRAMQQIAGIYDRHYSDEEVRELLQFFESPLGRKFAAESPKIALEMQAAREEVAAKAARDSLQLLKAEIPVTESSAALNNSHTQQSDLLESQTKQISERSPRR
ncbi:MAG: DUF2059 domain-containing protein [Acidobacteriota bacterium]|nr:DUF2059 domain-containing protein [Acidobacteriota bacterium]